MEHANSSFVFEAVTKEKIEKLITSLNIRKAVQSNDIPTKLVKEFGYLFSKYIATAINRCITGGIFVNVFKKTEVRQIYKKDEKTEELNYRPITILSNISKIYDRYTSKCMPILTKYSLKINAVDAKALIRNISFQL